MKSILINKSKLKNLKVSKNSDFPKYSTLIINQAASTIGATRPKVVGKLTEIFRDFEEESNLNKTPITIESWRNYHEDQFPQALSNALDKTMYMIDEFKNVFNKIDRNMVEKWIIDLLYEKTFYGLNVQAILTLFLDSKGHIVRNSSPEEESKNIDIFIDDKPFQIKPESHKYKKLLPNINIAIIYYKQTPSGDFLFESTHDFFK